MSADSWLLASIGREKVSLADDEAGRRRIRHALGLSAGGDEAERNLGFVVSGLELRVFDLLEDDANEKELRLAAAHAFQIARAMASPSEASRAAEWLLRICGLAVIGDRGADARRLL